MTAYAALAEDRDTLHLCLQRLCEDRSISMLDAIGRVDKAAADATLEHGRSATADMVLGRAGATFLLSDVTADRDSEVRALAASVETPAPAGAVLDALGRAKIGRGLAARVISDPATPTSRRA